MLPPELAHGELSLNRGARRSPSSSACHFWKRGRTLSFDLRPGGAPSATTGVTLGTPEAGALPLAGWNAALLRFSRDLLRSAPTWLKRVSKASGTFTVDARPYVASAPRPALQPSRRSIRDLDLDLDGDPEPDHDARTPVGARAGAAGAKPAKRVHQYELCELLGRGTYGKVKRAVDLRTGREYAVKILKKSFLKRQRRFDALRGEYESAYEDVLREVAILKKLSHARVVRLHEVIDDPALDKMYLVLELVRGGPALRRLPAPAAADAAAAAGAAGAAAAPPARRAEPLSEEEARRCVADVLAGLEYLHFQGVVHRDLKPDNILRDAGTGSYLICDLGVSLRADDGGDAAVGSAGTPAYSPPEVLRRDAEAYSGRAADVWSLGVTLYELLTGCLPFEADSVDALALALATQPLRWPPADAAGAAAGAAANGGPSAAARDLVERMLRKAPAERITVADARAHPWVTAGGRAPAVSEGARERLAPPSAEEIRTALSELDRSLHLIGSSALEAQQALRSGAPAHVAPASRHAFTLRRHRSAVQ